MGEFIRRLGCGWFGLGVRADLQAASTQPSSAAAAAARARIDRIAGSRRGGLRCNNYLNGIAGRTRRRGGRRWRRSSRGSRRSSGSNDADEAGRRRWGEGSRGRRCMRRCWCFDADGRVPDREGGVWSQPKFYVQRRCCNRRGVRRIRHLRIEMVGHPGVVENAVHKLPAIVISPGHGADGKASDFYFAAAFARNGFAVLSYDPLGQGERCAVSRPGASGRR